MDPNSSKKECDNKVEKTQKKVVYLYQFFQVPFKMENVKWKIAKGKRRMENGKWHDNP